MSRTATRPIAAKEKKLILDLLPDQGMWRDEDYLWLTDRTKRLVELSDGFLEFLPMPTDKHQNILEFMFLLFHGFLAARAKVHVSGLRLRLRPRKFREPDLLLLLDAKAPRRQNRVWS